MNHKIKTTSGKSSERSIFAHSRALIFVVIFALVGGVVFILYSRAATPSITLEAESGTVTSLATKKTDDSTASGGSYVQFGQPASELINGERLGISAGTPYLADGVNNATYMAKTASLGVKWIRLDAILDKPLNIADPALTEAKKNNLKALMVFTYGSLDTEAQRTEKATKIRDYINHWTSAGFSETVGAYELWNEPNNKGDTSIPYAPPSQMADFMRRAYSTIKPLTPNKTVVAGGYAPGGGNKECCTGDTWNPADYLDQLYKANGNKSAGMFDATAIHPYDSSNYPYAGSATSGWRITHWLRKVMNSYGDQNKEIWGTEAGWHSCYSHGSDTTPLGMTEDKRVVRFKNDMKDWFYGLHNSDGSLKKDSNGNYMYSAAGSDWNTGPFMIFKLYKNSLSSNSNGLGLIYTPTMNCYGNPAWYEPPIVDNIKLFSATKQSIINPAW